MHRQLFVMLMQNQNPLDMNVVRRHVDHLKRLEAENRLVLCGPFSDYAGGMVIAKASTCEEARKLFDSDPYIAEGYKTYELRTLDVAERENGYLLG
jgi:uncharacterized protein YciI